MKHRNHEPLWTFDNILDAVRRDVMMRLTEFLGERRVQWLDDKAAFDDVTADDLVKEFFRD